MKQLTALFVALALLLCGAALAAEWGEGLGPGKPYTDSTAINLDTTFGYIIMYPRGSKPANGFCNKLLMYFPREDVNAGEGTLTVYEAVEGEEKPVELCTVDMGDPRNVTVRPMTEDELRAVIWGGGVCAEIHLPKSLEYADAAHSYFVFMDEGCLNAGAEGALKSPRISKEGAWQPTIAGDYGISGLRYVDAELPSDNAEEEALEALFAQLEAAQDAADAANAAAEAAEKAGETGEEATAEEEETGETEEFGEPQTFGVQAPAEEAEEEEAPRITPEPVATPEPGPSQEELDAAPPVDWPDTGDKVVFDLVMGGEAVVAVPFSANGSVIFEQNEYTASAHVVGTVVKDDVDWGIVFLKEDGSVLQTLVL